MTEKIENNETTLPGHMTSMLDIYQQLLKQGFDVNIKDNECLELKIDNCTIYADDDYVSFSNGKGYDTHCHPEDGVTYTIYDCVYEDIMSYVEFADRFKNKRSHLNIFLFFLIILLIFDVLVAIFW